MSDYYIDADTLERLSREAANAAALLREQLQRCDTSLNGVNRVGWDIASWNSVWNEVSRQARWLDTNASSLRRRAERTRFLALPPWLVQALQRVPGAEDAVSALLAALHGDRGAPPPPRTAERADGVAGPSATLRPPLEPATSAAAGSAGMASDNLVIAAALGLVSVSAIDPATGTPWPRYRDCVAYVDAVMQAIGLPSRPGIDDDVYTAAGWQHSGFAPLPPNQEPVPGSFFQMGSPGNGHSGIYLGSSAGYAYVAQANWDGRGSGQAIYRVAADGSMTPVVELPTNLAAGSDSGAREALANSAANIGKPNIEFFVYTRGKYVESSEPEAPAPDGFATAL